MQPRIPSVLIAQIQPTVKSLGFDIPTSRALVRQIGWESFAGRIWAGSRSSLVRFGRSYRRGGGVRYSRGFIVSIAEEFFREKTEDNIAPQNIRSTTDRKRNKEEDRRIQLRNMSSALSLTRVDTCEDQS